MTFENVKPGDTVTRILGGAPMRLRVSSVDETFIHCGGEHGWKFDRRSGAELDEELGWGPNFGVTGSYLVHSDPKAN
jgi:hypothetical protein